MLVRGGKDAVDENAKQFEQCAAMLKDAGKKVGLLPKVNVSGPFVDDWNKAYGTIKADVDEVDIAPAISKVLAAKDEREMVGLIPLHGPCFEF